MKSKRMIKVMSLLLGLILISSQTLTVSAAKDDVELTVLNPLSAVEVVGEYAPRLEDLNGKRVALWLASMSDEDFGQDNLIYDKLAEKLKADYPKVTIIPYEELPLKYSPQDEVVEDILATEPDAVIIGVGG